jgi:hypothetical protein
MLTKCINASCSASFLHLAHGRLFRLESTLPAESPNAKETEYFWLCETCSAGMTLHLVQDGAVVPAKLREALCSGRELALSSLNRDNGRFLRSVTFLRRTHPKSTRNSGTRNARPHE